MEAPDQELMTYLWSPEICYSVSNFVRFVYPWGDADTPLYDCHGPRKWQLEAMEAMDGYLQSAKDSDIFRLSVVSGRGVGKNVLLSWLAHFMLSTRIGSSTKFASVTFSQLQEVGWPIMQSWIQMSRNAHWWKYADKRISPAQWLGDAVLGDIKVSPKTWHIIGRSMDKDHVDSIAGHHNRHGMMVLLDECSGIDAEVWNVVEQGMTDKTPDKFFIACGNGRKNSGRMFDIHTNPRIYGDSWHTFSVDGRTVEEIDQKIYDDIMRIYGEDSDEARVEIYGQFPQADHSSFISPQLVRQAKGRDVVAEGPLLMGVDPARTGGDWSAIVFRRGYLMVHFERVRNLKITELAGKVMQLFDLWGPDRLFVDVGGLGYGLYDILTEEKRKVTPVNFASRSPDPMYLNKRAWCWGQMKDWLEYGSILDDVTLEHELSMPGYKLDTTGRKLQLQSKRDMERSPDIADALALTFGGMPEVTVAPPSRHHVYSHSPWMGSRTYRPTTHTTSWDWMGRS